MPQARIGKPYKKHMPVGLSSRRACALKRSTYFQAFDPFDVFIAPVIELWLVQSKTVSGTFKNPLHDECEIREYPKIVSELDV